MTDEGRHLAAPPPTPARTRVLGRPGWLFVPAAVVLGVLGLMLLSAASQAGSAARATGKLLEGREQKPFGFQWFLVNADGSGHRTVRMGGLWVTLSPDGKWIASSPFGELLVTRTDGSDKRAIKPFAKRYTPGSRVDIPTEFHWSPDSRSLALVNDKGLWTASLARSRAHLIVRRNQTHAHGRRDCLIQPSWSPTGTYIAFVANHRSRDWLYIVRPDGTGLRSITMVRTRIGPGVFTCPPQPLYASRLFSWAPDGQSLVVTDPSQGILYKLNVKTGARRRLARGSSAAWAPRGQRILFSGARGVFVIRSDGSGRRLLVARGGNPVWSPDGTHIVVRSSRLVVMRPDGTDKRTVPHGASLGTVIDWSR